jgi:hypothetical protein
VTLQVIDRSRWPDVRPQETRRAGTNALLPDGELLTLAMLSQWPLLTLRRRPPASNAQFGRPIRHLADLPPDLPNCASMLSDLMRPWLARPSATLTGDRLPIAAGNCEGERVTSGVRLCHGSVFHSSLRKIMHATTCYMPCMHHVSASHPPLGPVRSRVCEMLDLNFREFLFHALR